MSSETLKNIFTDRPEWEQILNKLSFCSLRFYDKKYLQKYASLTDDDFSFLLKNNLLTKRLNYLCEGESITSTEWILDKKCDVCNLKIDNHEYHITYKFSSAQELHLLNQEYLTEYFDSDSIAILKELKSKINELVPFVGAGISKSFGIPSWIDLFDDAIEDLSEDYQKSQCKDYKSKYKIFKLIEYLLEYNPKVKNSEKDLKLTYVKPKVNKVIGNLEIKDSILESIVSFDAPLIITTNYDTLLNQTNNHLGLKYTENVRPRNYLGLQQYSNEKIIFYLHGCYTDLDEIILTANDYQMFYEEMKNSRLMASLLGNYSMLFLGFSMTDEVFAEEFNSIREISNDYAKHYFVGINLSYTERERLTNDYKLKIINIKDPENNYNISKQYKFMFEYIKGNIYFEKKRN